MGWLTRGTAESVLQVQLVPSFAGTDIESRQLLCYDALVCIVAHVGVYWCGSLSLIRIAG